MLFKLNIHNAFGILHFKGQLFTHTTTLNYKVNWFGPFCTQVKPGESLRCVSEFGGPSVNVGFSRTYL